MDTILLNKFFVLFVLTWVTTFDSLHERLITQTRIWKKVLRVSPRYALRVWLQWTREQWLYHLTRWAALYPLPIVYLAIAGFSLKESIGTACLMLVIWRIIYHWETMSCR